MMAGRLFSGSDGRTSIDLLNLQCYNRLAPASWVVVYRASPPDQSTVGEKLVKAIVWTKYGPPDVLQLREVEKPTPKDNEVLIRTYAATVTAGDCEARSMKIPILFRLPMRLYIGPIKPKRTTILGQELAGEIEAVGKNVKRFQQGDQIFAATGMRMGANAEYRCLPEDPTEMEGALALKPTNMTTRKPPPFLLRDSKHCIF